MQTQLLPAHAVRAGMHIVIAGSVYAVESNWFDRHGKAHFEPLNILVCNRPQSEGEMNGNGEHFGLMPTARITVILDTQVLM